MEDVKPALQPVTKQPNSEDPSNEVNSKNVAMATVSDVTIRNAVADDAEFVARQTVHAFLGKFEWGLGKNKIESAIKLGAIEHQSNPRMYANIFIAEYEGEKAGLIQLNYYNTPSPDTDCSATCRVLGCWTSIKYTCMGWVLEEETPRGHCYIDHICVNEDFRGKGIGKALMEHAESQARLHQCRNIFLFVAQSNRAVHLYERQGFSEVEDADGCLITWCTVGIRKFYKMTKPLQ